MDCPNCKGNNPPGVKFCIECGQPLRQSCPGCDAENLPRAKFCGECGTPLAREAAPASDAEAARTESVRSYTPGYLAEKILTSRATIEGERKQVTVLFADLEGSIRLESEPGQGAEVHVTVPRTVPEHEAVAAGPG